MAERKIHRVLVANEQRQLVGIVTAFDIVKASAAGLDFGPLPTVEAQEEAAATK
jgi:CBS domain-containing protein